MYRNHGMINRDKISLWGVNNRIQPLQAVVALEGLKKLDTNLKKFNADYLDKNLEDLSKSIKIQKDYPIIKRRMHYTCCFVKKETI